MDDNFYYNQGYYTDIDYVVKADELQGVYFQGQGMLNKWSENISNIENQLLTIIDMNSFEGATANNIKSYLFEAHLAYTIPYLKVLFYLFTVQYGSYIYGYSQIDSDIHMSVNTKTLDQACTDYRVDFIGENYDLIKKSLEDVSDLYTCSIPDIETINIVHEMMYKIPKELSESIVNYETNIMNTDVQSFNELILNILNMVNNLKERNNEFVLSYVENNITSIPGVNETSQLAKNVIQELDEKQAEIQLHQEYEAGVIKQLQKEEEERRIEEAKKRAKKGKKHAILNYIEGAVVVTVSVVAIVATDGAATPFVIAGATSVIHMASAVSDYNEYDEIGEAAKNGIVLDHGHNFMRDYLFGGNEKIYRKAMFVNDTITSVALLSGGVMNVASNSANASQFVRGVTKEIVTPIVACKATDSGIDLAADKLGMNEYLREGLKFSVDTFMTYKISQAGKTGNSNTKVVESIEGNAGKAVEGVSNLKYKEGYYVEHTTGAVEKFSNRRGISGGHNYEEFQKYFKDTSNKYQLEEVGRQSHPDIDGIFDIEYRVKYEKMDYTGKKGTGEYKIEPKGEPYKKTVYDPKIISSDEIIDLSKKAMEEGVKNSRVIELTNQNKIKIQGQVNYKGKVLKFEGIKNLETKEIENAYPVLQWEG